MYREGVLPTLTARRSSSGAGSSGSDNKCCTSSKHVPDCAVWFARAASVGSKPATPVIILSIEIVEIGETAGGEERAADGADAPFDAALLIAPGELIRRATPTDPCGTALASAAWRAFVSVFACPLDDLLYIAVCIRSDARS